MGGCPNLAFLRKVVTKWNMMVDFSERDSTLESKPKYKIDILDIWIAFSHHWCWPYGTGGTSCFSKSNRWKIVQYHFTQQELGWRGKIYSLDVSKEEEEEKLQAWLDGGGLYPDNLKQSLTDVHQKKRISFVVKVDLVLIWLHTSNIKNPIIPNS